MLDACGLLCEYRDSPNGGLVSFTCLRNYTLHTAARKESTCLQLSGGPSRGAIQVALSASYLCGCALFLRCSEDKFLLHLLSEWWQT